MLTRIVSLVGDIAHLCSGRTSTIDAPVVPIREASTAPTATARTALAAIRACLGESPAPLAACSLPPTATRGAAAARLRPDWHFVMLGPVVKIDPEILPKLPNLHWLGGKSYQELPAYISGWDVGIMPFALNEATRFISPTKTPEFLAAGVPVVSTAIHDVIKPYGENGLVEIAASAEQLVGKAQMLMERPREAWLERVDRHLANGSWDSTWAAMQRLIRGVTLAKAAANDRREQRPRGVVAEGAAHV